MNDTPEGGRVSKGQLMLQRKQEIANSMQEFQRTLPASIPAEKFVRTVQTAIQLNPDIAYATRDSVINACMKAAADGLILDGREAVLNIYNSKVKTASGGEEWQKTAVYIPMVTGIFKRIRNSGEVSLVNAFIVHKNDIFKRTLGLEMTLTHEPNDENPGEAVGVYAVCRYKDGTVDYEYMSKQQVLRIGDKTKNKDQYSPEKGQSYEEWWRKTAVRRLSKRLPMDSDIRNVIQRIDELQEPISDPETGEVFKETPAPKKRAPYKRRAAATEALQEEPASEVIENDEPSVSDADVEDVI
jgi:recombination protein RecT